MFAAAPSWRGRIGDFVQPQRVERACIPPGVASIRAPYLKRLQASTRLESTTPNATPDPGGNSAPHQSSLTNHQSLLTPPAHSNRTRPCAVMIRRCLGYLKQPGSEGIRLNDRDA
jgi:hypothetical protein